MQRITVCFFIFFMHLEVYGQGHPFTFTNYSTLHGLADNHVQSIVQDSRGFLWIGTVEGLSRFDGKTFKNYYARPADSIVKSNEFQHLFEYRPGHLIMQNYNRIVCFDTYNGEFYLPPFKGQSYLSIDKQRGQKGFSLSALGKAYLLDDDLRITTTFNTLPIAEKDGYLRPYFIGLADRWLMEYKSVFYFYFPSTKSYKRLDLPYTSTTVFHFRYADNATGRLYFADYLSGFYSYSMSDGLITSITHAATNIPFPTAFVFDVVPRRNNELWLLTEGGINVLNQKTGEIRMITSEPGKFNSLAANTCFASCVDNNDNLWIATPFGISKLNASSYILKSWSSGFETSLSSGLMSAVKGDDGLMYVSVYNAKTYQVNPELDKVRAWDISSERRSWNLFKRNTEIISTGSGNSLFAYDTRTKNFRTLDFLKPYYPDIEIIVMGFMTRNGEEWYSANRGGGFVRRLTNGKIRTYRRGADGNTFTSSYYTSYAEDSVGDLWFGVNKSSLLLHWERKTDHFSEINFASFPGLDKIDYTGINAVAKAKDGSLWIAFNGSGIIHYDPLHNTAQHFGITDGLPTDYIIGLAFDARERLWLTTQKGLSCFSIGDKKITTYKKEDGLPDDVFTDYCIFFDSTKNDLWVGANSTLMRFNPDSMLTLGKTSFPVYVDEVYVNSERAKDFNQQMVQLGSRETNLQFHFTAVELTKAEDIEYAYRLEGADNEWHYTGENQYASYSDLSPGSYIFYVRARHKGDNKWNETTVPLHFSIATPWFATWWFRLCILTFALLMLWLIVRAWYRSKIEKQQVIMERKRAIEMERTRIATDMHDDFGASLSRIKFVSEKMKLRHQDDDKDHKDLEKISMFSDEMAEKMNEIVWALNQRYDSLGDLVSFCRAYTSEYLQDKQVKLIFNAPEDAELQVQGEVRRNIFLVLKESLRNIIQHADATIIEITFSKEKDDFLTITIRDNGKGINTETARPFANGLMNMKKRIADINGSISITNQDGTVIGIRVPV